MYVEKTKSGQTNPVPRKNKRPDGKKSQKRSQK